MNVKKEIAIEKSIEEVWEVMGKQFGQVHIWSSNFKASKPGGKPRFQDLAYSERICLTERGETIQELDTFEPEHHSLAYHITKGLPKPARLASAVWTLEAAGPRLSKATFDFTMEVHDFVTAEMSAQIEKKLGFSAMILGEDLKHYMEEGAPHPRNSEATPEMLK